MLLLTGMLSMTGCAGAGTPIDEVSDSQAVVREASEIDINTNMHMASIMISFQRLRQKTIYFFQEHLLIWHLA